MSAIEEKEPRIECGLFAGKPDWERIPAVFLKEAVHGGEPSQQTSLKLAWTEQELFVLFSCRDTNAWATMTKRDAPLYEEEIVEVFLDPVGDLESYFEIEVNPRNAVCDLVLRRNQNGYRKSFAWNCEGLRTSVDLQPEFWEVEIAIPFGSLGPDLPGTQQWRANFYRIDRPENSARELSAWSPTGRPLFHIPRRFGWIDFVR